MLSDKVTYYIRYLLLALSIWKQMNDIGAWLSGIKASMMDYLDNPKQNWNRAKILNLNSTVSKSWMTIK